MTNMKSSLFFVFSMLIGVVVAAPGRRLEMPVATADDTEMTTNIAFTATELRMNRFRFELTFNATPSNNFEAAFGYSVVGVLSLGEDELVVGYDCGEWFVRRGTNMLFVSEAQILEGRSSTIKCESRIDRNGCAQSFAITIGGASIPFDADPSLCYNPEWNTVRLTTRGEESHDASFFVQTLIDGLRFILH